MTFFHYFYAYNQLSKWVPQVTKCKSMVFEVEVIILNRPIFTSCEETISNWGTFLQKCFFSLTPNFVVRRSLKFKILRTLVFNISR